MASKFANIISDFRQKRKEWCEEKSTYLCRLCALLEEDCANERKGCGILFSSLLVITGSLIAFAYYVPLERWDVWNIIEKFFSDHALITNLLGTFAGVILLFILLRPRLMIDNKLYTLNIDKKNHLKVRIRNLGLFPVNNVEVQLLFYRLLTDNDGKEITKTKKIELLRADTPILWGIFPLKKDSTYGCGTQKTLEALQSERHIKNAKGAEDYEGIICRVIASHVISGVTYVREYKFEKDKVDEIFQTNIETCKETITQEQDMKEDRNLFLTFLNDNIGRMNANSMNCKTLMAALNAGLLAACATSTKSEILWIAIGLTILLYFLDCYYLMLEKNFRDLEIKILNQEKEKGDISGLLFNFDAKKILGSKHMWENFGKAHYSPSTLWIYLSVVVAIVIAVYVLSASCNCPCCQQ